MNTKTPRTYSEKSKWLVRSKKIILLCLCAITSSAVGQNLSAEQLLEKSISYHDPNGHWRNFSGELSITMETPSRPLRKTILKMDFIKQYFKSTVVQDGLTTQAELHQGKCKHWFENSQSFSDEIAKKHRLNCAFTKKMRDYYVYLYGLPMKLKDPGTRIDPKVLTKPLNGKTYLCLRVTYDENVGKDIWYFYFDPTTYQLRHYQFYHDEAKNDGEYILLSSEETIQGIKMPKKRAWYTNKDDVYLGTDVLEKPRG